MESSESEPVSACAKGLLGLLQQSSPMHLCAGVHTRLFAQHEHLMDIHFDDAHPHLVNSISDVRAAGWVDRIGDIFPDSVTLHRYPVGGSSGASGINDVSHLWLK